MNHRSACSAFSKNQVLAAASIVILLIISGPRASAQLDPDAYTSLGTLTANNGDVVNINTSTGIVTINGSTAFTSAVTQAQTGAGSIRVFDFSSISIASGATVTVSGTDALGLLSQGTASVFTTVDASGAAGSTTLSSPTPGTAILGGGSGGAGATMSGVAASNGVTTLNNNGGHAVQNPNPSIGGQDGAGGGLGGPGGAGGATAGAAVGVSPLTTLVGGGGGSGGPFVNVTAGGNNISGAGGGAGGGAIEIIAKGTLTVSSLTSNGGEGGGAQPAVGGSQYGGGGAGGAIVLGGSALTVNGSINANGGNAVTFTLSGAGGGGEVALLGTPSWVLGSTSAATGLGVTVNVNRGTGGSANGTAGTIEAYTLGVTAPTNQTATFNGTNFTNVIPVQMQNASTPAITVTLGNNLKLDGGTLQFTTASTFGPTNTFAVTANGGIVDTQASNDIISSSISGAGGLTKVGTGALTLMAANTYQANTNVNVGTLIVANSQALGTTGELVQAAGTTVQTDNVNHAIVTGNGYNMMGGTLVINLNGAPGAPGAIANTLNDQVNVTGSATLGGNLTVNYNAGVIPAGTSETYTVVTTTTGVNSASTGFTDPNFNSGALHYTATGAIGDVGRDFEITIMSSQGLFSSLPGLTSNQKSVAAYLDRVDGIAGPGLSPLITALDNVSVSPDALGAAINQLMPLNFAHFASSTAFNGTDYLTEQMDNYFAGHRGPNGTFLGSNGNIDYSGLVLNDPDTAQGLQAIRSRLLAWNPAPSTGLVNDSTPSLLGGVDMKDTKAMIAKEPANLWNVFVAGDVVLGQDFSDNATGNAHDDSTSGEVRVGADYAISPNFIFGALFNYEHTDVTLDNLNSSATVDSYMPGLYASYADGGWYANAIGTYAFNSYTQARNVSFGGFDGRADSAPTGDQILGDLDGGYDFHRGNLTFGPTAGLKYIHLDVNGYTESGLPGGNLVVDRDEADSLRSRLGGRLSYVLHCHGVEFTPHFDVSWLHEFLDASRDIGGQFTGFGASPFEVRTDSPSRDSALMNLGLEARIDQATTVFGNYTVEAGQDNYFGQSVQAGVKIGF
jgi:uncharacterized protein YhjY with autotransporter beta-barrel domain